MSKLYVCIYVYIYMSRLGMHYGEAHTVVLYARAAIARPRDCTFFHNSTTKWTIRLPISLSMHSTALISDTVTDAAARTRALARERMRRQRELEERHHCYSVKT